MKKFLFITAVACAALAACNREEGPARVSITLSDSGVKADLQTADEAKVTGIMAFVFKGNSLDAYAEATPAEIEAKEMTVSCTQGTRDIWIVVNGPESLGSITTASGLRKAVSNLTEDNNPGNFVMVGKACDESVSTESTVSINVHRIVSRVRLFQVMRDMENQTLASLPADRFKIVRAYMTCVTGNACYDVFTPEHPGSYKWLSAIWSNSAAIATGNTFIYDKPVTAIPLAEDASYGTEYANGSTTATHTFYVYPSEFDSVTGNPVETDQMKLVVECLIDGEFYTYPIPLGSVSYNKTYDVKLLTIKHLGNNSNGDDTIDGGEDEVIRHTSATFSITVKDWTQVLTFGGVNNGNITI